MEPNDILKLDQIARAKDLLLEYPDDRERVARLIACLNEQQWKDCPMSWKRVVVKSADKMIKEISASMIKLDLGCGRRKRKGYIGVDIMEGSDIVANLTKDNLPFADSTVDAVYSDHFLEHLAIEDITKLMEDIHRVCRNGAIVEIRVPHFSGFTNFYEYHKTSFRLNSFAEFLWEEGMFLSKAKFNLISRRINLVNRQSPKNRAVTKWFIWNYPMEWLVNKMPRVYEMSGWRSLFPAWEIRFKFKVTK